MLWEIIWFWRDIYFISHLLQFGEGVWWLWVWGQGHLAQVVLSSGREISEQASNTLGHSQAAQPSPPHSYVFYWVFFGHRTPQTVGSWPRRPEGSTLAAVSVGQMPWGHGSFIACLIWQLIGDCLAVLQSYPWPFSTMPIPCCWEWKRLRCFCEHSCSSGCLCLVGTAILSAWREYEHLEQKEFKPGAHTALVFIHSNAGPGKGLVPSSEGFTLLSNFAPQLPRDIRVEEVDDMLWKVWERPVRIHCSVPQGRVRAIFYQASHS